MSILSSAFEVLAPSDTTTLVRGATTALCTRGGEVRPSALLGVFHRDERLLSLLRVNVDGAQPPLLAADRTGASTDRIASLAALDEYRNGQALLVRRRSVSDGMLTEAIELRSFGSSRTVVLDLALQSDGASVLALKSGKAPSSTLTWTVSDGGRRAVSHRGEDEFAVVEVDENGSLSLGDATSTVLHVSWKPDVEAASAWTATWTVRSARVASAASPHVPEPTALTPLRIVSDDHRWQPALSSAVADLDALIISVPERGLRFIGAGAPWYQALFGRDSVIAAWQTLPLGTELALDVLDTLAALQGTARDERTHEAPGKIAHEWRIGDPQVFGMRAGAVYFGSVDASALFVKLVAEAYRWGAPLERIRTLLPAARAAMTWCRDEGVVAGGRDRGPFLWYTPDPRGLGNQGWKDSGDCIVHADGSLASGPIAVAEAQAYLYDALVGLARLERDIGDGATPAAALEADAAALSAAFLKDFWLPSERLIALALDGKGVPLRVASSNMGQCLWSGILPDDIAARVVERTMAVDLRSPWGVRTLGDRERAYNPLGYHLGTVWGHDTAIIAAGCAQHGFTDAFETLAHGLLDAVERFDWRLPELYSGLDTSADGAPLPYPAACSPQAWSAGAPLLLLRSLLGLDPDVPAGRVSIRPVLPDGQSITVEGIRIGERTISVTARGETLVSVSGLAGLVV